MSKRKILFVCLGNICRSPLAEGIAKDINKKEDLSHIPFLQKILARPTYQINLPWMDEPLLVKSTQKVPIYFVEEPKFASTLHHIVGKAYQPIFLYSMLGLTGLRHYLPQLPDHNLLFALLMIPAALLGAKGYSEFARLGLGIGMSITYLAMSKTFVFTADQLSALTQPSYSQEWKIKQKYKDGPIT